MCSRPALFRLSARKLLVALLRGTDDPTLPLTLPVAWPLPYSPRPTTLVLFALARKLLEALPRGAADPNPAPDPTSNPDHALSP